VKIAFSATDQAPSQPPDRLFLQQKEGQPDVIPIELRVTGDDAVSEGQDAVDLRDFGILFGEKGAGAHGQRFRERAERGGKDGALVDHMVERRLADPGLGEKGVEAQATFSRDLTESGQIDLHAMIVPINRTEYNPSIDFYWVAKICPNGWIAREHAKP
jgi:hypothetical protein